MEYQAGEEWKTNQIAEEGLCWFRGRGSCQVLTDKVGGRANSMGGSVLPLLPPPSLLLCPDVFIQMPGLPAGSQLLQTFMGGPLLSSTCCAPELLEVCFTFFFNFF